MENSLQDQLENFKFLHSKMRDEGFHYCFTHYSNFKEISDEEFHRLRLEYIKSADLLSKYVESKLVELNNKLEEFD